MRVRPLTSSAATPLGKALLRVRDTPSRQSSARRKVQTDPRCTNLYRTLAPVYRARTQKDVPTLVARINTLHLPSPRSFEERDKMPMHDLMNLFDRRKSNR